MYVDIREERLHMLNVVKTCTRYIERMVSKSKSDEVIKISHRITWMYIHGSPKAFCADH